MPIPKRQPSSGPWRRGGVRHSAGQSILGLMLNAFGLVAVTLTLLFYALEDRSPVFVLAFGGGCLASAVYGFLQGAWPFGLIEIAWTVLAVRRWQRRSKMLPSL